MLLDGEPKIVDKLSHERMYSWYFTREELEKLSPSRKDGISESKESEIRHLYCSFIRDIGMRLKLYVISFAAEIYFLSVPFLECTSDDNSDSNNVLSSLLFASIPCQKWVAGEKLCFVAELMVCYCPCKLQKF
ncbi:hypothetical protein PR202_ga00624 [Eleusine coracana subsp. coracana]|uniref:Uncharacterized protein n=1 Tax=Eleusine coracana subsp. coracana TaxID=191504 RepID=A0AAV5BG14_ELECO|nr:hypothetical protein PR202_ga00624 [Eleusine coracana subsp. coracana]